MLDQSKNLLGRLIPQGTASYLVLNKYGKTLGTINRLFNTWDEILANMAPASIPAIDKDASPDNSNENLPYTDKDERAESNMVSIAETATTEQADTADDIKPTAAQLSENEVPVYQCMDSDTPIIFVPNDAGTYSILDQNKSLLGQLVPQPNRTNLVLDREGRILGYVDRLYSPWETLLVNLKLSS